jgi:spoIIIJ-associated protein
MSQIENIIRGLLDSGGFPYREIKENEVAGQKIFSVDTDNTRELIGQHGDTLHALDYLAKKILESRSAGSEEPHFLIDVDEYRTRQIRDIEQKALMMAERARSFQYDVELSPMSSYERLIVHTALQNAPNVKTESQGEGRNRRIVIKYAG